MDVPALGPGLPAPTARPAPDPVRTAAEAFETVFLAEMLKHAGLNAGAGSFGGGAGESQFSSLLTEEQARRMVAAGGIGIADRIEAALTRSERSR